MRLARDYQREGAATDADWWSDADAYAETTAYADAETAALDAYADAETAARDEKETP
jgi:hypothetical protein